jgi:hypothetical protein
MKLNPQDLKKIADLTLEHYNQRADASKMARIMPCRRGDWNEGRERKLC